MLLDDVATGNAPDNYPYDESDMPELSRFYGIIIKMYYDDHGKPHFHAVYAGDSASIDIRTGFVLDGYLPARALQHVQEWTREHEAELLDNWDRAHQGEELEPIEPLE
jgi:hypothetical protein